MSGYKNTNAESVFCLKICLAASFGSSFMQTLRLVSSPRWWRVQTLPSLTWQKSCPALSRSNFHWQTVKLPSLQHYGLNQTLCGVCDARHRPHQSERCILTAYIFHKRIISAPVILCFYTSECNYKYRCKEQLWNWTICLNEFS